MSELIQKNDNRATIRWKLLTGASALALTAYVSSAGLARAEDSDRPQIWIELGGQLSRLPDSQEAFSPPLMDARPSIFAPSREFEKPPLYSIDETGRISFQPSNSSWIFSASIRYGRSSSYRSVRQQTHPITFALHYTYYGIPYTNTRRPAAAKFADTNARTSESHAILDFQVGKDVGLGLFGSEDATSVFNVGVRFAQFRSKTNVAFKSDPDWHFNYIYTSFFVNYFHATTSKFVVGQSYHNNQASLRAARSFSGIGPSLSWKASVPLAGNPKDSELTLDWGLNAALLFGKQRAKVHHQSTSYSGLINSNDVIGIPHVVNQNRTRSVTVPNVGGFAGLSFQYSDAKLSFGYKADFFFNAIDGGIDARKSENRGFFGPYASISVGLGD